MNGSFINMHAACCVVFAIVEGIYANTILIHIQVSLLRITMHN